MNWPLSRAVSVGSVRFGDGAFALVAGPCAIESRERLHSVGEAVLRSGAVALRGGVFKLRTKPTAFQGLGEEALRLVDDAKQRFGVPFFAELTDPRQIESFRGRVDAFQVGSRNMHNYELLKELGRSRVPVLLKRGFCARLDEWLHAAEYIAREGNENILLCERGIRTFETAMRNTLDLAAIPWLKARCPYPVLVDPSHGTGMPELVAPMTWAAAAAGADGALIEVHDAPAEALSDGPQALTPPQFDDLVRGLEPLLLAQHRTLARSKHREAVS